MPWGISRMVTLSKIEAVSKFRLDAKAALVQRTSGLPLYVVGNSADFDFFTAPLVEDVLSGVVGVASITVV